MGVKILERNQVAVIDFVRMRVKVTVTVGFVRMGVKRKQVA
jgi:hypothetical protein